MKYPSLTRLYKCRACGLCYGGRPPVPWEGPWDAQVMWIGINPGRKECEKGRPFVGPSGQRLDVVIEEVGLEREDCILTNVVKGFTVGNRRPTKKHVSVCSRAWLRREILAVRPRILITLGRLAEAVIEALDIDAVIAQATGFAMLHPSAALRVPLNEARLRKQTKQLRRIVRKIVE